MRALGKFIWRFMVIFSFIVNFVLIVVLLLAGLFIFQIKNQVADPLIGGLHSTAAGLGESTIDWVIPVRDSLGIDLEVPINAGTILSEVTEIGGVPVTEQIPGETVVTLTRPVPIAITGAYIDAGNLQLTNATVNITLPAGTQLPVALDLVLGLQEDIPVELDVRAVIPLGQTQLNDPINQLGLLFEPLAIGLHNLPDDFSEAGDFTGRIYSQVLNGNEPFGSWLTTFLLSTDGSGFNDDVYDPWFGFSQTAGYNYDLASQSYPGESLPIDTQVTVPGGIPALDALLPDREQYYDGEGETPMISSQQAADIVDNAGIPPYTWDGSYADYFASVQGGYAPLSVQSVTTDAQTAPEGNGGTGGVPLDSDSTDTNNEGYDIIPTPSGN